MSCCAGDCTCNADAICACDDQHGPRWNHNPSGLPAIAYRVGDFASFRHELAHHLDGERVLSVWRPSADGDLALQIVEWWAYVADVLTFYSERIANESFLGTALLPESVNRLVQLLGYRPRPGIGATATLAMIAASPDPLVLPDRFAVSSKAKPGLESQTFELTKGVTYAQPTSAETAPPDDLTVTASAGGPPQGARPGTAEPPAHEQLIVRGGVLVKGKPSSTVVGDRLLLVREPWSSANDPAVVVTVTGLVTEKDPHGKSNTRVLLDGAGSLGAGAKAKDYRLRRPTHTNHLVTVPIGSSPVKTGVLVLDGTARFLHAGDPLLVERPSAGTGASPGFRFDVVRLDGYKEVVWYANGTAADPTVSPGDLGIPLVVAWLTVSPRSGASLTARYGSSVNEVSIHSGWTDVGTLLDTPVTRLAGLPSKVTLARVPAAAAGVATPALVEDARGHGASVTAISAPGSRDVSLSGAGAGELVPPLRLLWDLVTVTRGESVRDEQLGRGDATLSGQDFTLSRSPVTYLADGAGGTGSRSGDGYSSTVELVVDGVRWEEVPTLFGRAPDERVFTLREDEEVKTHVLTGDGVEGMRLPTGAVVSASYRIGSGAVVPAAGSLSQILAAAPNLSAVRNPVAAAGGSDPDPPSLLRTYAQRSVLTFGRAVSGTDYEAVAALAPGVRRAAAVWGWDPAEQRALVRVFVGDDAGAVASARTALRLQSDPNRPVIVLPAVACWTELRLSLRLDPAYVAEDVVADVRAALLDGLFAPGSLRIGERLYRSRIEGTCDHPAVRGVRQLRLRYRRSDTGSLLHTSYGISFSPGEAGWFDLTGDRLLIATEVDEQ